MKEYLPYLDIYFCIQAHTEYIFERFSVTDLGVRFTRSAFLPPKKGHGTEPFVAAQQNLALTSWMPTKPRNKLVSHQIFPIYSEVLESQHIINCEMGKKLRNRELITDTQNQSTVSDDHLPCTVVVGSSFLRKKAISRKNEKRTFTEQKHNRFNERLQNKEFSTLLDHQRFQCPICLDLIISPMMMNCGHIYCYRCLDSNTAYSQRCCLCRQDQEDTAFVPLKMVENLIQKFILPQSDYFRYLCRTTDSHEWRRHRTLAAPKLGLVVDFRSTSGTWKKGVISRIYEDRVQIKTTVSSVPFYETIDRKSPRLAPFTFFTKNRYLLDFPPVLPEFDNTQVIINSIEYRHREEQDFFDVGAKSEDSQCEDIQEDDQNLRIFNLQMQENELLFNIE